MDEEEVRQFVREWLKDRLPEECIDYITKRIVQFDKKINAKKQKALDRLAMYLWFLMKVREGRE